MYSTIAKYYDLLGWGEFHDIAYPRLKPLLLAEKSASYLDLACGTGSLAFSIAKLGVEVVGIDKSSEMLEMARKNLRRFTVKPKPEFLHYDMTRFNLKREFDAVGCFFDAANHITSETGFAHMLKCAGRHLRSGGFLMFDVNTVVGMKQWDAVLFSKEGEHALLMKGSYNTSTRLARITIAGHVQLGEKKRDQFKETFHERAYVHKDILKYLRQAGFGRILATPMKPEHNLRTADRVFYTAYKK